MATAQEPTTVVFRRWRASVDANRSVIALFPAIPADTTGRFCTSYDHIGQHGGADYSHVVRLSSSVSEAAADVQDLRRELEGIGYMMKVRSRASQKDHEARKAEAQSPLEEVA